MATETSSETTHKKGELVRDVRRNRVGVVMDRLVENYWLRPPGGGKEWEARPEDVETVTSINLLSARVAEANHRSRA